MIVHRGSTHARRASTHTQPHRGRHAFLASNQRSTRSNKRRALQQLNGRARSTENTDGIQIVRHGGALNVAALGKIVRDVSGYPLCKDAGLIFPVINRLLLKPIGCQGFGNRPSRRLRHTPNLECVTVDTLDPTNPDDLPRYPLRDCVNVYVRFNANEVALEKAKKFLDRVVCRIAQDQQLLLRRSRPLQVAA